MNEQYGPKGAQTALYARSKGRIDLRIALREMQHADARQIRPLLQAILNYAPASSAWIARTAAIEAVCDEFGVPLRAAALQFPLAHPAVSIVIVGAHSGAQWYDNVAMLEYTIPAAFWSRLRERGLLPPDAPVPA